MRESERVRVESPTRGDKDIYRGDDDDDDYRRRCARAHASDTL